ncbi:MAG: phenylalanine--tRNA ligase subunit beta [Acidobacteria bacterium]|nr:phenylalanine--tRNA ligase subunit beta [Acidobacteriota bacterium]
MKFPVEWVREFVGIDLPAPALASKLTSVGFVVDAFEGEGDSAILDVDVAPNRPDAMNMYGLAREIAAFSGRGLYAYPAGVREAAEAQPSASSASVEVEAGDLCRRYCARVVRNVKPVPSPEWMARRLRSVGLTGVNSIVDITNYVLWELGHPLHAFDLALLAGKRLVVRRARKGEAIQTLDGVARHLDPEMLVIADARAPVALAGVMGGAGTMISASTRDVLLEAAWFDPSSVRRTAKRLGLATDASYRFERGADIEAAHVAIDRAASLLAEIAGGEVAPGVIDVRPGGTIPLRTVHLRLARVATLLGMRVDADPAAAALSRLGFEVRPAGDGFEVVVPRHRLDIEGEADLVEEIGRSVGYDAIPDRIPHLPGTGAVHRFAHRREETLRSSLLASGYSEAITYSFTSSEMDWPYREEGVVPVAVTNPMSEGQETLRSTLLPGLAAALRHNVNRGVKDVRLFEIGRVFRRIDLPTSHEDRKHGPPAGVDEPLAAALAATGLARARHWGEPARESGFHDVKGALEEAFARLGLDVEFEPPANPGPFRPGACASVTSRGVVAGRVGVLSAETAARLGLKVPVTLAEIDLSTLLAAPGTPLGVHPLPRFPAVSRDLALVVRRDVLWRDVRRAITAAGGDLVTRVTVFDRYEGKSIPAGHVSLAVNVLYQHADRTLAADEVQSAESNVLAALARQFGISLRQQAET